jgi:hypothetical protein
VFAPLPHAATRAAAQIARRKVLACAYSPICIARRESTIGAARRPAAAALDTAPSFAGAAVV